MTEFTVVNGVLHAPDIDPSDRLDYTMNFAAVLGIDTIDSVLWVATTGITVDSGSNSNTTSTATVWLKDGVLGQQPTVTCRVTTVAGRIIERSFKILCKNL